MANYVITIGRQCGSGGHTIGKLVAQRLELAFYDKEIVELAAAKTKLSPEFIRSHGEDFNGGCPWPYHRLRHPLRQQCKDRAAP